jgi:hypothetical protein
LGGGTSAGLGGGTSAGEGGSTLGAGDVTGSAGAGGDTVPSADASAPDGPALAVASTANDAGAGVPIRAIAVTVGQFHSCALLEDHAVKCWGLTGLGYGDALARGTSAAQMGDALPTVDLGTGRTADAIGAGFGHTCAILDDGSVKCWGNAGGLGLPDNISHGEAPGQMGDALPALDLGAGRKAVELAVGYLSSCARLDDGTVKCWGDDLKQTPGVHVLPTTVPGVTKGALTLAPSLHNVFAFEDGSLIGMIPGITLNDVTGPPGNIVAFGGGREMFCEILAGGAGTRCQNGVGGTPPQTLTTLVAIGVGEQYFSCGIHQDGKVSCWGLQTNRYWTDSAVRSTFGTDGAHVLIPTKARAIASGAERHICALDVDGRVWCWGDTLEPSIGASAIGFAAGSAWGPVDLGTRH